MATTRRDSNRTTATPRSAQRAARASLGVASTSNVTAFLDSFADIDRGYFMRVGLVDRRYNPRVGWHMLRHLYGALDEVRRPLRAALATERVAVIAPDATAALWQATESPWTTAPTNGGDGGDALAICLLTGEVRHGRWVREGEEARYDGELAGLSEALLIMRA